MAFADLKNDFVFRRIFAAHPEILRRLLNDLLERTGERTELAEMPPDWPAGPYRAALELANQATFTQTELDAYRKVFDEIQQVRDLAEAKWTEGKAEGLAEGEVKAKREALYRLLLRAGLAVTDDDRARIQACTDPATLDRWFDNVLGARSTADVLA